MNITRGKKPGAKKIVVFGPEGIGKSTFASQFPDPLFIDTEESTKDMDVARFDVPSSWEMLKSQVAYVIANPSICRTLVIDTADWAERLEIDWLCNKNGWDGLEGAGYGKGYTYSAEEFGRLLDLLTEVIGKGINVVITAHAQLRKVELPEEMGAYDHWEMKTSKKVAPMIREWADAVFFANYKVTVINVDNQGAQKGKNKAQGGRRVMYTVHTPFWDAKNRYGLPEELPFEYKSISHILEPANTSESEPVKKPEEKASKSGSKESPALPKEIEEALQAIHPNGEAGAEVKAEKSDHLSSVEPASPELPLPDARIPKNLRDLMITDNITEWDIENICEAKGYVPRGTKIWEYDTANPGLINGGLIGHWSSVIAQIREMNEKEEVPFVV